MMRVKYGWIALGATLLSAVAGAQELDYYLDVADNQNPELQAMRLKYDLAVERVEEAGALPDTEIGAGLFVSEPETRTGAQKARFSIRQMLPWFGGITAREALAGSMAEVDYLDWVIARRKLRLETARGYYRLQALQEQIGILQEQEGLLDSWSEIALTGVSNGRASAVDVLKLDIRKEDLVARRRILENQYDAAHLAFFKRINAEQSAIAFPMESWPDSLPPAPPVALGPHPELERYERLYESVARDEALNRKEAGPRLGFGVDYIPVAERTDMTVADNGKDILMPMVSLSVPLFNTKYRSRTRQNELRQEALQAEELSRRNTLETLLADAWQGRESARIRYNTGSGNILKTRQAAEILLKNYQTDTVDFTELLEIQEIELRLLVERTEALEAYLGQAALVNYLTAEP